MDCTPAAISTQSPSSTRTPAESGRTQNPGSPYVPQATGSNNGGLGVASDANFKDIYASFQYRFNLERDKQSRDAIQAAGPTGPRDHTYLNFGSYYFYGRSVQRLLGAGADGTSALVTAREPFYRVGGNMTFNYRCCLQFNALYMYGHDYNLLPIDASGQLIPLQNLSTAVPWASSIALQLPSAAVSWMRSGSLTRGCMS